MMRGESRDYIKYKTLSALTVEELSDIHGLTVQDSADLKPEEQAQVRFLSVLPQIALQRQEAFSKKFR